MKIKTSVKAGQNCGGKVCKPGDGGPHPAPRLLGARAGHDSVALDRGARAASPDPFDAGAARFACV